MLPYHFNAAGLDKKTQGSIQKILVQWARRNPEARPKKK